MNPFDLRGPEFLAYYATLGIIISAILALWPRRGAAAGPSPGKLTDPYLIATLRGGPEEALRVATCELIDRGLLRAKVKLVEVNPPHAALRPQKPLERALLEKFATARPADDMFQPGPPLAEARALEERLIEGGLVNDWSRKASAIFGMILMGAIALIKIVVAFNRGRHNVFFLILLAGVFMILLWLIGGTRRSIKGLKALADLRTLFRGHRAVSPSRWNAGEMALVMGVFGLSAAWAHGQSDDFRRLFPKSANARGKVTSYGRSCGTSCGTSVVSSCGSSGGSSCGGASSCGGGGGGGGCGGCGGS